VIRAFPIFLLSWLSLSILSAHSGVDLEWYLTTDYVNPIEYTSFQFIYFFRALADTYESKAQIISFAIGLTSSLSLFSLNRQAAIKPNNVYFLIPFFIFIPPIYLGAESMYRQAVGQLFFLLFFIMVFHSFRTRHSLRSRITTTILLLLAFNSHKGFLFISPALLLAYFAVYLFELHQSGKINRYQKSIHRSKKLITVSLSFLVPIIAIILNLVIGPLATAVFGSSTRLSSSGMTYLYYCPFLFQIVVSILSIHKCFKIKGYSSDLKFSLFVNSFILLSCTTALFIFANPEYFQRTYYIPLMFISLQVLLPSTPFTFSSQKLLIVLFSAISLLLIFSPQYQYLINPL